MKRMMVLLAVLSVLSQNVQAQEDRKNRDPVEALIPAGSEDAGAEEWNGVYAAQLHKLLADKHVNPAAVLFTGAFCQTAALPADPLIAAFLVYDLVMENDYLLRTGCLQGEIMVRMKAVWNRHLRENRGLLGAGVRERKAKKDRTPAGPERGRSQGGQHQLEKSNGISEKNRNSRGTSREWS
jgi:hypothetical protein